MTDLLKKLAELEELSSSLEPNQAERDHYFQHVKNWADQFISHIEHLPAYSSKLPDSAKLSIGDSTKSIEEVLQIYTSEVSETGIQPASAGHIGYIPGGGIYLSALGDYLADISNEYAGMFFGGPGAVTMEHELINWMKTIFGFPKSAVGNLTSGGSIANLIALTAARDKYKIKNAAVPNSVIYLSEQVHHCTQKALRIIGLEDAQIRYIRLDEHSRMIAEDLADKIAADKSEGLTPFLVLASAGTTDTGAVDPLKAIGEIAQKEDLWYHIDGAYGGFFILTERAKHQFEGIEMADSLCIDPHKGLFLPYGSGAIIVKDKKALFHSHHYTANYMQDAQQENDMHNPADVSPELTKHFRGLRMWLPLQILGIEPFKACLEEKLYLTDYFRNELVSRGFEVGPTPDLSVSYFWYPSKTDENEFNTELMKAIHADGSIFLTSTNLQGKQVIRIAILSFRTKKRTIDACLDMIDRCLEEVKNKRLIS